MNPLKPTPHHQKSIFLYGPQGCGKTLHAHAIAMYMGLRHWREDFDFVPASSRAFPKTNHLLITNVAVPKETRRAISFATVMAMMARGEPFTEQAMAADAANIPRI